MKKNGFAKRTLSFFKEMLRRFEEHEVGQAGAQLAYFFILSIFPFLIFLNALIGLLRISPDMIIQTFADVIPPEVSRILSTYIESLNQRSSTGLFSFGIITTVMSSSKAFDSLLHTLKKAYGNEKKPSGIYKKLTSIVLTLSLGGSILLSMITLAIGRDFWIFLSHYFNLPQGFVESWVYLKWIIIFTALIVTLSGMHFFIPDVRPKFRHIVPGTIFTIIVWIFVSALFSFYVKNFASYSVIYGSLGAMIILLLWLYLTGIIIVTGGELNAVLIDLHTSEEESPSSTMEGDEPNAEDGMELSQTPLKQPLLSSKGEASYTEQEETPELEEIGAEMPPLSSPVKMKKVETYYKKKTKN